ncbi:hypothetical protein C8Q80DRAFT_1273201 [Daedaleopsis nitida]|nr:hypothetical protein C8Q80DRAFT_1273201 [Daedaleopsis nitida]
MSSPGEIAELVAVYSSYYTNASAAIASNAFFVYDYLMTLVDEVEFIWRRRRLSVTSAFFLVLRYPTLWNIAVNIVKDDPHYFQRSAFACDLLTKMSAIIVYSRYFPVAVFSGMRAYALCKSWALTVLITVLSLAPMAVNFAQYALGLHGVVDPIFGCGYTVSTTQTDDIILLFILNVLHLAFTLTLILGVLSTHASGIGQFTDPLSCVLVYRFILDLQEANRQELKLNQDDPLHFSVGSSGSVSFARIVGPLGSTIVPGGVPSGSDDASSEDLDTFGESASVQGHCDVPGHDRHRGSVIGLVGGQGWVESSCSSRGSEEV